MQQIHVVSLIVGCLLLSDAGTHRALAQKGNNKKTGGGSAAIAFPAKSSLNPEQGTIEAIVALAYNYGDPMLTGNQSASGLFALVAIHDSKGKRRDIREIRRQGDPDDLSFNFGFSQHRGSDILALGSSRFERIAQHGLSLRHIRFGVGAGKEPQLKAGEWHAVGATWQRTGTNYALAIYLDGKRVQSAKLPVSLTMGNAVFDSRDLLVIGNPAKTLGSVQSLRISQRARTAEEIAAASKTGLAKDADTLLYVDGELVSQMKPNKLEDLTGDKSVRAPPEGRLFGYVEIIAGRDGKAFRFP